MEGFISGMLISLNPIFILYVALGVFLGIYVGAIPGLSVAMAVSLLTSFTYSWEIYPALALMIGVFIGGVYGGSRSAILLNIPGAPAACATAFDGYPLAKLGQAGSAMGLSTTISVFGTFFGILVLMVASPFISKIAINFFPQDYFLLAIIGLFLVGSLSEGSLAKGLAAAFMGVIFGFIGMDPFTGQSRLTFGNNYMLGGINFVTVMIGLFGLSEGLVLMKESKPYVKQNIDKIRPSVKLILENLPLAIRASVIGTIIGALPGTGGDIAALMAYDHAKRSVKNPSRPFGQGAYEGIIAPESANNAAIGGAFIPMLTMGIPGDATTAILIGALGIHGLRPGPMLMKEQPAFFWVICGFLLVGTVFLYIFGMSGIKIFSKIVEIPKAVIVPTIIVLSVIGSFAINSSLMDVYFMMIFGILGYFLKIYKYPVASMILGVILSPLIEQNFRRSIDIYRGDIVQLIISMFTRPITLVLMIFIFFLVISKTSFFVNIMDKLFKKEDQNKVKN